MDKFEINFTYTKYCTLNPLVFWKSLPGGQVVMIPPHSPPSDKMIPDKCLKLFVFQFSHLKNQYFNHLLAILSVLWADGERVGCWGKKVGLGVRCYSTHLSDESLQGTYCVPGIRLWAGDTQVSQRSCPQITV